MKAHPVVSFSFLMLKYTTTMFQNSLVRLVQILEQGRDTLVFMNIILIDKHLALAQTVKHTRLVILFVRLLQKILPVQALRL